MRGYQAAGVITERRDATASRPYTSTIDAVRETIL